jgi:hypothetical protein
MLTQLAKIACALGLHSYREWNYVAPTVCQQLPTCEWCGHFRSVKNRTVHIWGNPVYSADGKCEKIEICLRCRAAKPAVPAIVHVLHGFSYTSSDSCVMARTCDRCRWIDLDSAFIHHSFGEWVEAKEGTCQILRNCMRCRCEETEENHDWLPQPYGKSCMRCRSTRPTEPGLCYQCGRRAIPGDNVCYSCI